MKPFNLQAVLSGAPVITRDRRRVEHVFYAPNLPAHSRLIYALVTDHNVEVYRAYEDGRYMHTEPHPNDLFMAPGKQTRWVNLYRLHEPLGMLKLGEQLHASEITARVCIETQNPPRDYVATIPIQWEE